MQADDPSLLRRYWLRQLDEAAMSAVERRYFAERDFFDEVEAAADELVDDFVYGRLSASERRAVADLLSLPTWQARLALAERLRLRLVESGS